MHYLHGVAQSWVSKGMTPSWYLHGAGPLGYSQIGGLPKPSYQNKTDQNYTKFECVCVQYVFGSDLTAFWQLIFFPFFNNMFLQL